MTSDAALGVLAGLRVGFGFDIQRFEAGKPFTLGGALFDQPRGLVGSGDGDAVCRALIDALLSACAMPDIDTIFPEGDPAWHREGSYTLLSQTAAALHRVKLRAVLSVSVRVVTEEPNLAEDLHRMQALLAEALLVEPAQVGLTFGGNQRFDAVGRGEALVAFATLLCVVKSVYDKPGSPAPPRLSATQTTLSAFDASIDERIREEDDKHLPERVRRFENAVKSGLPPLPPADPPREGSTLIVYTDGASRGNPGLSATAFVVMNELGQLVHEEGRSIGTATNNQAEYEALIDALKWIQGKLGTDYKVQVRTDSELMARQVAGEWKIKDDELKVKALAVMNILLDFTHFEIKHVPRAENTRADKLCNMALDG